MSPLDWLKELISFDTTSHLSNLALIDNLESYFSQLGLPVRKTFNSEKTKANLFATLPGDLGEKQDGLILSGHTDVVPVTGQQWHSNPFQAVVRDDSLYGRGSTDMKGFIACTLAVLPHLLTLKRNYPIHFAFSYDEEIGCFGAPVLIEDALAHGYKPRACIVGEPTNMRAVIAHKGIQGLRCKVMGKSAHSSLTPQGCNAIDHAALLIVYLREVAEQLQTQGLRDEKFDVPFTTLSTNTIKGGNANNIIPSYCEFSFDLRYLPQDSPRTIIDRLQTFIDKNVLPAMKKETEQADVEVQMMAGVPSFSADLSSSFVQLVREVLHENEELKVAYATEAGQFQAAGISTIVCGPGSIEQAHKPDEYIELSQIEKCETFLKSFIEIYQSMEN